MVSPPAQGDKPRGHKILLLLIVATEKIHLESNCPKRNCDENKKYGREPPNVVLTEGAILPKSAPAPYVL